MLITSTMILSITGILLFTGCLGERVIDHSISAPLIDPTTGERISSIPTLHDGITVDRDVYTGTYENGSPFEGVEGEVVEVDLSGKPASWHIALLHASLIARQGSIELTPDELLAVVAIVSELDCVTSDCFDITQSSHIASLQQHVPERFDQELDHEGEEAFPLSAHLYVYSKIFAVGLWTKLSDESEVWLAEHPDPHATSQALYLSHMLSPFNGSFSQMFEQCGSSDALVTCLEMRAGVAHFQRERLRMSTAIATALGERGRAASVRVTRDDFEAYLEQIAPIHPERDEEGLTLALDVSFARSEVLDTQEALAGAILRIHANLGDPLTLDEMRRALCFSNVLSNQTCAAILDGESN